MPAVARVAVCSRSAAERSWRLFLDLRRGQVGIERVGRQRKIVAGVDQKTLIGHVPVVISGKSKGGWKALNHVVVVVFFSVGILVFIQRIAPLPGTAQGQVGFGVG